VCKLAPVRYVEGGGIVSDDLDIRFDDDSFRRTDEEDDSRFYAVDRLVNHIDDLALETVERIIGTLIVERRPALLDLMAGWNSHLPETLNPSRVVGLGLNTNELARNAAVTEPVIHDLNREPRLPFDDESFDVVLNTLSVDYLTRPIEVFRDVARVLKPGGLFLVIFSNRMFPQKAVKIWRESSESVRVDLVRTYFARSGGFLSPRHFASIGRPRPSGDRYQGLGLPSDPVYAVYADRQSEEVVLRPRPEVAPEEQVELPDRETVEHRKRLAHWTLRCPHCDVLMTRWKVPDTPFNEWDADYVYVCFNATCPYTMRSRSVMHQQGNVGFAYRLMYHRERDRFYCVPDVGFDAGR
jgi:SAM-dependent methyltransferase